MVRRLCRSQNMLLSVRKMTGHTRALQAPICQGCRQPPLFPCCTGTPRFAAPAENRRWLVFPHHRRDDSPVVTEMARRDVDGGVRASKGWLPIRLPFCIMNGLLRDTWSDARHRGWRLHRRKTAPSRPPLETRACGLHTAQAQLGGRDNVPGPEASAVVRSYRQMPA